MAKKGFVDIQVNGLMGINFSLPGLTVDDIGKATRYLMDSGTVAYCPTIVTGPMEMYRTNLAALARARRDPELAGHIPGIHLEGPFISPEPGACGAHQPQYVRAPSIEEFELFMEWSEDGISILTLAPERPGAIELIKHASGRGVVVSIGHHWSGIADMEKAVAAGAVCCTHLGNGIPNMMHRHDNPLWYQLSTDELWATFITDGHHLPPALIKTALRAKTLDRFIVISDAASLAGMPPGVYDDFGKEVVVEPSGRISCESTGTLAGSHSTMLECMNHLASLKILSEADMWKVGCSNPMRLLGKSSGQLDDVEGPLILFDGDAFIVDK